MSCHRIGRAANSVIESILEQYDKGKISFDICKELIKAAQNSIGYCDGNFGETIISFEKARCGKCLETYNNRYCSLFEMYYNLDDEYSQKFDDYARKNLNPSNYRRSFEDVIMKITCTGNVCDHCLKELAEEVFDSKEEAQEFLNYLENHEYAKSIFPEGGEDFYDLGYVKRR